MRSINWWYLRRPNAWWFLALLLLVVTARCVYVSLFAVETPFWDQWDSEADLLLRPWKDGTWTPVQLFSPHNEHRIAFTRILSIAIFELNGQQWNNLVEAYANTALAGIYLALLFVFLAREAHSAGKMFTAFFIMLAGILPFSWENFLVGFQSQFYFMTLMAILMMAVAAFMAPSSRTTLLLTAIGFASLFTAASGLIGAISVILITASRSWRSRRVSPGDYALCGLMILVIVTGFYITPSLPYHESLKAAGIKDNVHAVLTALMWPIQPLGTKAINPFKMFAAALIMWSPAAVWSIKFIRTRKASRSGLFAIGMASWAFIQCVALAHSRGHEMLGLASRYMDIPAIALIINGWLAFDLLLCEEIGARQRRTLAVMVLLFAGTAIGGFVARNSMDFGLLEQRVYLTAKETANVRGYMLSGDAGWLDQPWLEIPYPSADRLKSLLDNTTIAEMLPPSVRRPVVRSLHPVENAARMPSALIPAPGEILDYVGAPSKGAQMTSIPLGVFRARFPYVVLYAAGSMGGPGVPGLTLKGSNATRFESLKAAPESWRRAYAASGNEREIAIFAQAMPNDWLAVTSPVEAGRLSAAAEMLQDRVRKVIYHVLPNLRTPPVSSSPHAGRAS